MQPHLAIHRVGASAYIYSFSANSAPARHGESMLDSLVRCLDDAADSLGHYFPVVMVSFEGLSLGCYATLQLQRDPARLAREMMGRAVQACPIGASQAPLS